MDAMARFQLRRIPIVDDDHRIVGIISQGDVATRVDQPEETAMIVREISQPYVGTDPFENKGHQDKAGF
jgi:CBS domain-containing protein